MRTILLLGLLLCAADVRADDPQSISMGIGSQKIVTVTNMERVAVGDASIVDVKVIGNSQVLLSGASEGSTTLLVWRTGKPVLTYQLRCRKIDGESLGGELRRLLGDREGIDIRMVGDRIYLDGQAHTADDLLRVNQVLALYPNVTSFVRASPDVGRLTAQQITLALQRNGYRDVKVTVIGATVFLEGTVESEADRKKAELLALALLPHDAARP